MQLPEPLSRQQQQQQAVRSCISRCKTLSQHDMNRPLELGSSYLGNIMISSSQSGHELQGSRLLKLAQCIACTLCFGWPDSAAAAGSIWAAMPSWTNGFSYAIDRHLTGSLSGRSLTVAAAAATWADMHPQAMPHTQPPATL